MLIVVSTHPIQYQAPLWRELAKRIPLHVIYLCNHGCRESYDAEFGKAFRWDIDLLDGYSHEFVLRGSSPAGFWSLSASTAIWRSLRGKKPSAVWIQGWQVAGYWQAALAARLLGADVWLRGDTNLASGARNVRLMRRAARHLALQALFALTTHFLYVGQRNYAFYRAHGVDARRLTFAPHGVDNARFRLAAHSLRGDRGILRKDWRIPTEAFCFLFVGKFIPKKRPLDLLYAAERLATDSSSRKIHILWVGEGELLREVQMKAEATPANLTCTFPGFLNQSEIGKAYAVADCLVLPSGADETWGLVVNEAMASGVPAIISDACGCAADLAIPQCEELIYPVGDTAALARSMARVMQRQPSGEAISHKIDAYDIMGAVEAVETLFQQCYA